MTTLRHVTETEPGNAAASLRYYRRKRFGFLQAGLNTRGKPYQRRPFLTDEDRARYNLAKWHRLAQQRAAAGLTTRGTVPKFAVPETRWEQAWREFRKGFEIREESNS